jgi:glyoxylase-like metal-dependent hydrolase (beta-lactamase superfamily II)
MSTPPTQSANGHGGNTMALERLFHGPCEHAATPRRSAINGIPILRDRILEQAVPLDYFERNVAAGVQVHRIPDTPIYTFRYGFSTSLVIDTDNGVAVFDSFSAAHSQALASWIATTFSKRVRWLVYSHYHLDHTRGGALLNPVEVIGHGKCTDYWADFDTSDGVCALTTSIVGDTVLRFGEVEVELLDVGLSHTDTLYAFHLPAFRTLFTADLGFVRALPPFGFPDWYYPGYMRALDRVGALNFDTFVATHGELGTRSDLVAFTTMMRDVRETVDAAAARYGHEMADGRTIRAMLRREFPRLRERYGDWHGFDGMMLPLFFRHVGGVYLGH